MENLWLIYMVMMMDNLWLMVHSYPLVMTNSSLLKMVIEIVDLLS